MPAAVFMDLAVSACATTFTPGPNNILLLSSTSTFGFKKCRPLMMGIWEGLLAIMLLCGLGCAVLGELVPLDVALTIPDYLERELEEDERYMQLLLACVGGGASRKAEPTQPRP